MQLRTRLLVLWSLSSLGAMAACGSRTGLLVPLEVQPEEGGLPDAGDDGLEPLDAFPEPDATEPDVGPDVLPPIDVTPPMDVLNECPDSGSTLVYVISKQNELLSFYPPTASFRTIGVIGCPAAPSYQPFSMAVDRTGTAYVLFANQTVAQPQGQIFKVSTLTAACTATPFHTNPTGAFPLFGMGFSENAGDGGETLYLAGDPGGTGGQPATLGSLDTTSFFLSPVGQFTPVIVGPELTGTGAGDLFAFYATNGNASSAIGQIDKTHARIIAQSNLPGVAQGAGWAFAFWGGDFYTFTAPAGTTTLVTRFRPSDGSIVQVATTPGQVIVGAGVSTCAPQH